MEKMDEERGFEKGVYDALKASPIRRKLHEINPFNDFNSPYEEGYQHVIDHYSRFQYYLDKEDKKRERRNRPEDIILRRNLAIFGALFGLYVSYQLIFPPSQDSQKSTTKSKFNLERIVNQTTSENYYKTKQ